MRRTAGVRRDVAVAGRRTGSRARAAAGAGPARRAATQVPRMLVLALPCVACSVRGRAARSQRSARSQPAPAPARTALAPRAPPARRHPPAPRRAIRRLRPVSTRLRSRPDPLSDASRRNIADRSAYQIRIRMKTDIIK